MNEKITVFILAYNRTDYLRECLASLKLQSYQLFKTIILDNCSEKNLEIVISEFPQLNIEYIKHNSNLGSTGNFTYAWQFNKTTEYFVIFHDDDLMHPLFLETEVKILEANKDLNWVASDSLSFKGLLPEFPNITETHPVFFNGFDLAISLISGVGLTFSSTMYRSQYCNKINLKKLINIHSIIFDRPLLFDIVIEGKCALMKDKLVLYRCHEMQDSRNGPLNEDNLQELFVSYKKMLMPKWSEKTQKHFYSWSGFQLVDGYKRLGKDKKSSFFIFIKKAKEKEIYKDILFFYYICGLLYRLKTLIIKKIFI